MLNKIETAQLINGGTVALALGALSLALGHTAIFLLLALAGLSAYGLVIVRYARKRKAPHSQSDQPDSEP
jgi:hypothetical protein